MKRVLRDNPSKGRMHNRQPITLKMLWQSITDYDLWPAYEIALLFEIPGAPPKAYLALSLKAIGFGTFNTTLLSIPVATFTAINLLWITWITENTVSILSLVFLRSSGFSFYSSLSIHL